MAGMSIQEFINAIAKDVAAQVAAAPPKIYDVTRNSPKGPVLQKTSLPQVIAELTDAMKIVAAQQIVLAQQNAEMLQVLKQHSNVATALVGELDATRKIWRRKRRRAEDDDED